MCGILYTNKQVAPERFNAALKLMHHRGPDAAGCWTEGEHQLGHNRLKIVDLDDRSNQPFHSGSGRYVTIFNGEIYNFRELAQRFGIVQRTTCDTEVVVELFASQGPKFVEYLEGMFAIVIVDRITNKLFVARDRLGVKPLYYSRTGATVTIASELAAVLAIAGEGTIDEVAVRQYKKLRTFFNGRTLYSHVQMFPAGCYSVNGRITRYWELPREPQSSPATEEIASRIRAAVAARRIADVPVGSYLSGGLDSTIVAALAGEPHTWTVGFTAHNEFPWARIAAERFGSTHHEVVIQPDEFLFVAREMIRRRREPLSVPNEVLLYRMTQEVKKFNTVILSGEGADELFFGYDRIFRWAHSQAKFDVEAFDQYYSYGKHADLEIVEDAVRPFLDRGAAINVVAAFFQTAHLHGLLRRLDNATMLCAVEARVPFVDDHRLVERMAGVGFEARMLNGVVKGQLKQAFKNLLPPEIVNRPKIGFPVPLEQIAFPEASDLAPMERWLNFNLSELGLA